MARWNRFDLDKPPTIRLADISKQVQDRCALDIGLTRMEVVVGATCVDAIVVVVCMVVIVVTSNIIRQSFPTFVGH